MASQQVIAPQFTPAEKSTLRKVMWFGILQLVGLVSGWVVYFYVFGTAFSNLTTYDLESDPFSSEYRPRPCLSGPFADNPGCSR